MSPGHDPAPHKYRFGPFLFRSALLIPELAQASGPATIPVSIALGGAPEGLHGGGSYGEQCHVTPTEYLLDIPGVARFYVANGCEVRVDLYPHAPAPDISGFLLGSIFGALCHQNAILPLHASAIERSPGRVTAFLGESGAGKSTLAAALQRRSYSILSDDICLLQAAPDNLAMHVIPLAGWLKLWRQSFDHLGQTPDEQHRVFQADDKYRLYLASEPLASARNRTLANHVFLSRATTPDAFPTLALLPTVEVIAEMMRLTYLGYVTELTRSHARVFAQCARVLNRAKGYRLTVPWNLSQLDATLDLLDRTLLQPAQNNILYQLSNLLCPIYSCLIAIVGMYKHNSDPIHQPST